MLIFLFDSNVHMYCAHSTKVCEQNKIDLIALSVSKLAIHLQTRILCMDSLWRIQSQRETIKKKKEDDE